MLIKNHNFELKLPMACSKNGITNPKAFRGSLEVLIDERTDLGSVGIKERTGGLGNLNP